MSSPADQSDIDNLSRAASSPTTSNVVRLLIVCSLPVALLSAAFLVVATLVPHLSSAVIFALMLAGAILVISPRSGIALFILLIPILGNRPGTVHAHALLLLACWINLSFLFHAISSHELRKKLAVADHNPIVFLCLLYVIASIMSLTGLPLAEWVVELRSSTPAFSDSSALIYRLSRFLMPTEESLDYSILSVFLTISACNLLLLIFMFPSVERYSFAILTGLLLSLTVGLLDYYGLVDLRLLRPLDPVVNPNDVQFRLQSFFGHSGWFAQYVTLTVPFVLLLLALPLRFATRVSLLFLILILGEFVLILTFQRGGWLSYPITLIAVWSAIYLHKHFERGTENLLKVFKKSCLKICLCLPVTVVLSIGIISLLNNYNLLGHDARSSIDSYARRFQDIAKTDDRTSFMRAGYLLGKDSPLLGRGSESFAFHYDREFREASGRHHNKIVLPLFGSAHNVYFQTFSGKGAAGLLLLLALVILCALLSVKKIFTYPSLKPQTRLVLLSTACFVAAFLIYGNVQEIFYVQSLQFLFFTILAIGAFHIGPARHRGKLMMWPVGLAALILIFLVHLFFLPGQSQILSIDRTTGCHRPESDPAGQVFSWCGPRARLVIAESELSKKDFLELHIQAAPFPLERGSAQPVLRILQNSALLSERQLAPEETLTVSIPKEALIWSKGVNENFVHLDIHFSGYLIPRRDFPGNQDIRALSYRLLF